MMRIAWIIVGLCTATLASAQMARPPDAPPVLPHSFDGNLVPAWPLSELPLPIQERVAQALAANDCATATTAVTGAYIREYPRFRWILRNRQTLMLWWFRVARSTYPDIYVCDVIGEFRAAAASYVAQGGDFRWCGQSLLGEPRPDKKSAPALYRLMWAIDDLLPMTLRVRQDVPFSVEVLRAILASDKDFDFIVLPLPVRFNILLILEHTGDLTAAERAEFNALADEIAEFDKSLMMEFIDSGYESATVQSIHDCIESAG